MMSLVSNFLNDGLISIRLTSVPSSEIRLVRITRITQYLIGIIWSHQIVLATGGFRADFACQLKIPFGIVSHLVKPRMGIYSNH